MRSERRRRFVRGALGAALWALGSGRSSVADVIDRILAVVDGRPLMLSEVRLVERVRGISEAAAVEALIDERLMLREASRLPQAAVTPDEEEKAYSSLLALHPAETTGIPESDLRRLARRQTAILKYVEFRFRPQIRVADEEVRATYDEVYGGRDGAPSYESAAEGIRARLVERALDERIEAWVRELRSASEVRYNR